MKKPLIKKIALILGILIIITPIALVVDFLVLGDPVGAFFVQGKISSYAKETYPELDLKVSYPKFNVVSSGYYSTAVSKNDDKIQFTINYSKGKLWDTYEEDVRSGGNATKGWEDSFNKLLKPIFQNEFGEKFEIISVVIEKSDFITDDKPFDKSHPVKKSANIRLLLNDLYESQEMAEVIQKCLNIMEANDIEFVYFDFTFEASNASMAEITNLKTEYINEDLTALIKEMQKNPERVKNETGIVYFSKSK